MPRGSTGVGLSAWPAHGTLCRPYRRLERLLRGWVHVWYNDENPARHCHGREKRRAETGVKHLLHPAERNHCIHGNPHEAIAPHMELVVDPLLVRV